MIEYQAKERLLRREVARTYYGCKARVNEWTEKMMSYKTHFIQGKTAKKLKQLISEGFPDRDLKTVYNRANYLGLKKTKNLNIMQKD